jgi:hypothetical protein
MVVAMSLASGAAHSQDLTPRAYVVTPVGSNAITLAYSFFDGSVFTDPTVPVTDFKVRYNAQILSYFHAFSFFGRTASVVGSLPYAVGHFQALVAGTETRVYRSGLADTRFRFAVNLRGGSAMRPEEYVKWRERSVLGASVTLIAPTGQYDPARLVNPGLNRWAVKPELGFSRRWGHWSLDLYGGVWFFGANQTYFPGRSTRSEAPVGSVETHLAYSVKPRLWFSADANFWTGGRTSIDGVKKPDLERNSRIGATAAIPLDSHQSLKFSYSAGAYVAFGGDYKNISAAWQYSWLGRPR